MNSSHKNILILILVGVIALFLLKSLFGISTSNLSIGSTSKSSFSQSGMAVPSVAVAPEMAMDMRAGIMPPVYDEPAPVDSANRIVIQDTSLSLVVNDVSASLNQISNIAQQEGGFLVNSNLSMPEEAASGVITIRVPVEKRDSVLKQIKQVGVNVVSESVEGRDVTDQYEDIEARLAVLNETKAKFETILDQATEIQDLLQVQRELISLQSQIDSLKGRQEYLTQNAKLTKISIYLSTDELALPYAPDNAWRPQVVFKQAVRSLVATLRSLGNLVIWGAVFSVVLVPLGLVVHLITRFIKSRKHVGSQRNN